MPRPKGSTNKIKRLYQCHLNPKQLELWLPEEQLIPLRYWICYPRPEPYHPVVDAWELYAYLKLTGSRTDWVKRQINAQKFVEGEDYHHFEPNKRRKPHDYVFSIRAAYIICKTAWKHRDRTDKACEYFEKCMDALDIPRPEILKPRKKKSGGQKRLVEYTPELPVPSSSNVQTFFNPNFGEIRTIIEDGEIWFVAKDVAERIGCAWSGMQRIEHIPEEWRRVTPILTPQGMQAMAVMNMPGTSMFLFRSDKPLAIPFQKWLAGDVVPSVLTTGTYSLPAAPKKIESEAPKQIQSEVPKNTPELPPKQRCEITLDNGDVISYHSNGKPKWMLRFVQLLIKHTTLTENPCQNSKHSPNKKQNPSA